MGIKKERSSVIYSAPEKSYDKYLLIKYSVSEITFSA